MLRERFAKIYQKLSILLTFGIFEFSKVDPILLGFLSAQPFVVGSAVHHFVLVVDATQHVRSSENHDHDDPKVVLCHNLRCYSVRG